MKVIYLLSGPLKTEGFNEEIKKELLKDLNNKKTITFIASNPDDYDLTDMHIYGKENEVIGLVEHLSDFMNIEKINVIDTRVSASKGKDMIIGSDVLYLVGGDNIKQIEYIKNNNYSDLITSYNGIIIGTSAGAMNLGKIVYYSKDKFYDKSFIYKGLGVTDIIIDPHFDVNNIEQIKEAENMSAKENIEIIGLPDESAIRIEDNSIAYINNYYIFNGAKRKVK